MKSFAILLFASILAIFIFLGLGNQSFVQDAIFARIDTRLSGDTEGLRIDQHYLDVYLGSKDGADVGELVTELQEVIPLARFYSYRADGGLVPATGMPGGEVPSVGDGGSSSATAPPTDP